MYGDGHDHGHDQGTVTVRSGTVRYERSRSRAKNETFTVFEKDKKYELKSYV